MPPIISKAKPSAVDTNALIRPLRSLCGLTQEQFAAKLGVSLVTINRWENNRTKPTALALRQLKLLLIEMSQSEVEADRAISSSYRRAIARRLLAQYFPKDC